MTPDFFRVQGALEGATLLVVASDATRNTGKKTSQIVYFFLAETLKPSIGQTGTEPAFEGTKDVWQKAQGFAHCQTGAPAT